jgi:serine protease Do/serine protease DegQ
MKKSRMIMTTLALWMATGTGLPTPAWAGLPVAVDGQALPSLSPMLERITPAVVNIATRASANVPDNPLLNDPVFRFFFEQSNPNKRREKVQRSLGSGVVIDEKLGYVITNNHVVDKAETIIVALQDGRRLQANIVGRDPETDIAVIQIPPQKLTAMPLGNSDRLRVGDFVVAVGNPFGLGQTVTSGIISALSRSGLGIEGYEDFIQTDASINPGNSGGALVDLRGDLIGINTAILSQGGKNVGIGFAIPVNMVKQIKDQLVEHGEVRRGMLGWQAQDLTPELATAFRLDNTGGALITRVDPGSGAHKAGVRQGDIVVEINGHAIRNRAALHNAVGLVRAGDKVSVRYLRNGDAKNTVATVEEVMTQQARGEDLDRRLAGALFAIDVDTPTNDAGLRVLSVSQNSVAWRIGLRPGDALLEINKQPVSSFQQVSELAALDTTQMLLTIVRANKKLFVLVKKQAQAAR